MNHWPFVYVSYALFVLFIIWDWLMPRWKMRQTRRRHQALMRRKQARKKTPSKPVNQANKP